MSGPKNFLYAFAVISGAILIHSSLAWFVKVALGLTTALFCTVYAWVFDYLERERFKEHRW